MVRHLTPLTSKQIGALFNIHYTTVLHGSKVVRNKTMYDKQLRIEIGDLKELINEAR